MQIATDFGYVGDAGDSAPAINAAIAAAVAQPRGGAIQLPSGTIYVASTVVLPKTTGKALLLRGEHAQSSVFTMAPTMTGPALYAGSGVAGGGCQLRCENLGVAGASNQVGLVLQNANGFQVRGASFRNLGVGISASSSYWAEISECEFDGPTTGINVLTAAHGFSVRRCGFYSVPSQAVKMVGAQSFNVSITENDFETVGVAFQSDVGVGALAFERNYVEYAQNAVIYLPGANGAVSIRSNEIQSGAHTVLGGNISGVDFSYNDLWNQGFTITSPGKTVAGNLLRGSSSIQ